jgi:hypothetical protein
MSHRTVAVASLLLVGCAMYAPPASAGEDPAPKAATSVAERPVDLCLCLDTSNSMDGLIDAARRRLWDIVNDLSRLQPKPRLRVALLSYGNLDYPQAEGWVRVDAPFTEDLDFISERLFALRTHGGEEYVGRVLDSALTRLEWSDDAKALRIAIVAGNESADQDQVVPFLDAAKKAAQRGVIVNSIYCGDAVDAIAPGWRDLAKCAEGEFAAIDQDRRAPVCATPYDELLAKLSASLNTTYLPFGAHGAVSCSNQTAQDANASGLGLDAACSRAATKASCNYRNGTWDLVDAVKERDFDLAKLSTDELPDTMRKLTLAERTRYVEEMAKKRAAIQREIGDLAAKRTDFIATEMKRQGLAGDAGLEGAVRRAVRKQAERKGFTFDGC